VAWGLCTALLFSVAMAQWDRTPGDRTRGFLSVLPLALLIFPVCGYFWGVLMWHWLSRGVRKNQPDADTSP
jgi:hypothetical protein